MLIEVKDLKRGDEIVVAYNGSLRYFKLLNNPELRYYTDVNGNKVTRSQYKAVRCSTNCIVTTNTWTAYNGKIHTDHRYSYKCTAEGHNFRKSIDLNYNRGIWLVKRENY